MGELGVCGVVGQGGTLSVLAKPPESVPEPEAEPSGSYMSRSGKRVNAKIQQINAIMYLPFYLCLSISQKSQLELEYHSPFKFRFRSSMCPIRNTFVLKYFSRSSP